MYRFNIRCLLTVAVCFLVISVLYLVVFQVTFPVVCIALTLTALLISYFYLNSNAIRIQLSPYFGPPPADEHFVASHSPGMNMVDSWHSGHSSGAPVTSPRMSRRPGAITNDRAEVSDHASVPNSAGSRCFDRSPNSVLLGQSRGRCHAIGTKDRTRVLPNETDPTSNEAVGSRCEQNYSPCAITDNDALPSQHIREQIRSQASQCIPVQTTKGEHSNRSLADQITTANVNLGQDFQLQSDVEARRYNSSSISPNPQLPKSGCPVGSDNTTPERFPYTGQIRRSTANETVTHPTHQLQYGCLGVLPLVHLSEAPHSSSEAYRSQSLSHGPVTVKIAPPDPLIAPVQFMQPESTSPPSSISTSSLRKRNAQHDEALETGTTYQQMSNKRRRLNDSVEYASSSSPPITGTSCSGGMNLKRPALSDVRAEMGSPKHRRLQPSAVPSPTSQPGASARNPIDASYTSSERWLKRKYSNVGEKVTPDRYQDTSQSSPVEIESRSARTSEVLQKSSSEGQVIRSNEEEHFPCSPCESSLTIPQPSDCRNSPSYASLDKGQPDDNFSTNNLNLSKHITNKDQPPCNADAPMLSQGKSDSTSYKVHLTYEDVERDRHKEMEDAELGPPGPCAVSSSAPLCASLPQVATASLQPASGLLSVADSLSPAAATTIQQHTSAGTTVVYSTPAQLALRYDLTSSLGSPLGHLPVLSAANPNPPTSLNSESTVCQPYSSTSAASVMLTAPAITTLVSPVCSTGFALPAGSLGGFSFDPHASNKTSLSGFVANPSSLSSTVGGFKYVPSNNKSMSAAYSLQFPQCVTTSEIASEITSKETRSFHLPAVTKSSTVSASTNSAAVFSFGQTASEPALSFSQPHTASTSFTANRTSSANFLSNISRSEASGSVIPSSNNMSFSGMFGCSVSSSSASKSVVEDSSRLNSAPSSSTNAVAFGKPFDGNPVTGMMFNSKGFFPSVDTANHSLVLNRQHTLASNSAYESQLKSANNAGNQPMPEQTFGACITSGLTFGALPARGTFAANQPLLPFSFGSQQAVTNSFSIQPTTTIAFSNQYASVNAVMSTPVASVNTLGNSKTPLFSFTSPTSVNFPSNSEASVFSFNNPTSTVSISKASLNAFSFGSPTSINSLSTSETSFSNSTSLNLFGSLPQAAGQFANQGNNSTSGFGGLPSYSDVFGNQQLTSSNSCGKQQMATFNFGTQTTLGNVFDRQTKSTNILGSNVGDVTQTGGFGSYVNLSAPSCLAEPKAHFSNPQFTQAQFPFPSVHSGDLNNSSVLNPAFQFPHSVETTSVVTSTQSPAAPNPFSSAIGFSQLQNNSPTMNLGQFPTQPNQFSTAQPQFDPQAPWTPRFSIGTDNSNSAKNRSLSKSRVRRKP